MDKLFIEDLDVKNQTVLMRVDYNVPLDGDKKVLDATRIEATLPSIKYILDKGGALILMSHLGRPKGTPRPDLSLAPAAKVLSKILNLPVQMAPGIIGSRVRQLAEGLKTGEILMLENLRFARAEEHPEEDPSFSEQIASLGNLYVNDAFGCSHRKHASIYTVPKLFQNKAASGYLLEKEIRFLGQILESPKRPFTAILGGAKISTKIGIIKSLLKKVDKLLIGGAMAYTFLKAQGYAVGDSLVEEEFLDQAKELLDKKIVLPLDIMCAKKCSEDSPTRLVDVSNGIPEGYQGLDIGPKTIELFSESLKDAKTILWNGPLGVYELERFAKGTRTLAKTIGGLNAIKVAGGGDLIAALKSVGETLRFTHISTGGGATLEYIELGTLPGIEALSEKKMANK